MPWLAPALVVVFLLLIGWLSDSTHEDDKTILKAAKADIARAYDALSANKPDIAKAKVFLGRWV